MSVCYVVWCVVVCVVQVLVLCVACVSVCCIVWCVVVCVVHVFMCCELFV